MNILLSCLIAILPPLPWAGKALPPGEPGVDFTPCVVPNGTKASYEVVGDAKVFHLTAEKIIWKIAEGLTIRTWGYNGQAPGPVIEVAQGDRVRIYVTNKLPAPTTVHWHGLLLPCGMDGVAAVTQPAILPGETFLYDFICPDSGIFMYHSHYDSMTQEGMGLSGMFVVHKREPDISKRPDRDFVILLNEFSIEVGTERPFPAHGGPFNILTMNGKVMPDTEPLVAKLGDRVWIRYGNLSAMDHHPIHLHGYSFKTIGTSGGWAQDPEALLPMTTVLVPVGQALTTEFFANNPGDWIFHCHMTHHTMNQMGHDFPNMLDVDMSGVDEKICFLIPGYKTLGTAGMRDMARSGMPLPPNSIPMLGYKSAMGDTVFGGMANILKVRAELESYEDPGPYEFPEGTMAAPPTCEDLERDGIDLSFGN